MLQPTSAAYVLLYELDLENIRNMELVGNTIGVFHKFESNCSFWSMKEQRTVLCINIQNEVKQLAEKFFYEDNEEDLALYDDDHVTAVYAIRADDDYVLLYGTRFGCLFGMSVKNRTKLFQIPCPLEQLLDDVTSSNSITGLGFVADGKIGVTYEKLGLLVMDFSAENPRDRPPTRHSRGSTSTPGPTVTGTPQTPGTSSQAPSLPQSSDGTKSGKGQQRGSAKKK